MRKPLRALFWHENEIYIQCEFQRRCQLSASRGRVYFVYAVSFERKKKVQINAVTKNNGKLYGNRPQILKRQLTIKWDMTEFKKQHTEHVE